jgi:hypothetical protein
MTHTSGLIFRTTDVTRWGSGKGSNLTPTEVDENFYDLDERVVDIELNPPLPVEISAITVVGASMTIHMADSSTFGPFTLPTAPARTWFTGSGAPAAELGEEGDLYLDTAGGDVYQHQGTTGWVQIDNLTGPTGAAGADGTTIDTLDDVPDVDYQTAGPAEADVLVRRGALWVPEAQTGAPATLDEVGDVDYPTAGPAEGEVLVRRSGAWVPEAQSGGGGGGSGAFPFKGALVTFPSDLLTQDFSPAAAIPFDEEQYDTDAFHDNSTNNTRLTVPAGVTRVRLKGVVAIDLIATGNFVSLSIKKNGASSYPGKSEQLSEISNTLSRVSLTSPVLDVVATDYFELFLSIEGDSSVTLLSDKTSFSIEAVETTESGQTATVQTTDATQTVLASGAMAADSAHTIRATGHGREDATGDTYHFEIFGGARNEGGTSSAPTPNVTEVADAGAATWDATFEANDTSDEWEIKVTGEAAHTIDWTVTWFEIVTQP